MQKKITFDEIKNKPQLFGAVAVSKRKNFMLHPLRVKALAVKYFMALQMTNKQHMISRMRDGPLAEIGPPDIRTPKKGPNQAELAKTGPPQTGPPMEWLVLKQTRARY